MKTGLYPLFTFVIEIVVKLVSHLLKQSIAADERSTNEERNQ